MEQQLQGLRDGYERAVDEMRELDRSLADLEQERAKKLQEVRAVEALLSIWDPTFEPNYAAPSKKVRAKTARVSLPDEAFDVMNENGSPMYYVELHDEMISRGIEIPGQNPPANLLTQVSQDERFIRVGKGTYALRDWTTVHDVEEAPQIDDEGADAVE